jgi:hypothetical protein
MNFLQRLGRAPALGGWMRVFVSRLIPVFLVGLALCARAQDKKDAPRLTGAVPLEISPGADATLKFRGLKLDSATEIRFPSAAALKAELKDKKKADLPNGLEAKDVGDTQCEANIKLPADVPVGPFPVELVTPAGSVVCELQVVFADTIAEEKEPNNGFREAQPLELGKTLRGKISEDKDVDVFSFQATKGQRLELNVRAARATSMLDPLVTLYDDAGRVLKMVDDTQGRDPVFIFEAPADGRYLAAIQDTGDRGSPWHAYQFTLKEAAK